MTSFANIPDKTGRVVKFVPTPQQKYLMQNKSKYNIILKARQAGISCCLMLYACYLALTRANVTCLLMSYSTQSVTENFSKLRAIYDYLPDVVKKEETANSRTQLSFINHSKIICCTCGSTDKARGSSIILAHVSEAGLCKDENLEKQLLAIEQYCPFNYLFHTSPCINLLVAGIGVGTFQGCGESDSPARSRSPRTQRTLTPHNTGRKCRRPHKAVEPLCHIPGTHTMTRQMQLTTLPPRPMPGAGCVAKF